MNAETLLVKLPAILQLERNRYLQQHSFGKQHGWASKQ
jgi:hypothetical protein